MQPRVKLK